MPTTAPVDLFAHHQDWWDGVVYAAPGYGKSIVTTSSQVYNTFVFDVDDSLASVKAWRIRNGLRRDNIMPWPVREVSDFDRGMDYVERLKGRVGIIVVDSATELQRLVIREVSKKASHLTPDQRDWGVVRTLMENMTVRFRGFPAHVIYTCHEINKFDPDFGRDVWRPSFDGRFAFEYAKHFSWIARYRLHMLTTPPAAAGGQPTTQLVRALDFGPDPYMHFKDRSGAMPRFFNPDIDAVLATMNMAVSPPQQVTAPATPAIAAPA